MTDQFFRLKKFSFLLILIFLIGCSATFKNHGYSPSVVELEQLRIGVDSKQSVKNLFGSPSSLGLIHENQWFYLSTKIRHFSYRAPEIIDRNLVAISFTSAGILENIERFKLDNQDIVVLSRRTTESGIKGVSLIKQILNSAGNYDPTTALE